MSRFTVHGSDRLEATIAAQLRALSNDVLRRLPRHWLDCLVLGGGYGRGEGGAALRADGTEAPHNDYDLVLVHRVGLGLPGARGRVEALRRALRSIERAHSQAIGLHVDILPVHRRRVRRLPPALTWYEFGRGHRVLWGDGRAIEPLTRRSLRHVHPSEWGRLLMNRAVGLTFARWVRRGEPCSVAEGELPDAFVTRQIQKAWLALGDVWLAERNAYHHLVRERLARFEVMDREHPIWAHAYRRAVEYKLLPRWTLSTAEQDAELERLAELYVPLLRGRPASPARPAPGLLATLRYLPPQRWWNVRPWAYPRERLRLAAAAELLGDRREFERLAHDHRHFVRLWARYG